MRRHFKLGGLVSRTEPNGKTILSPYSKLRKKYLNGTITDEELYAFCHMAKSHSDLLDIKKDINTLPEVEETENIITVWGKNFKVSIELYNSFMQTKEH